MRAIAATGRQAADEERGPLRLGQWQGARQADRRPSSDAAKASGPAAAGADAPAIVPKEEVLRIAS
jgi:hypothetical protein